jgi:hypothetical protein
MEIVEDTLFSRAITANFTISAIREHLQNTWVPPQIPQFTTSGVGSIWGVANFLMLAQHAWSVKGRSRSDLNLTRAGRKRNRDAAETIVELDRPLADHIR